MNFSATMFLFLLALLSLGVVIGLMLHPYPEDQGE
jgi:hypothetical protein